MTYLDVIKKIEASLTGDHDKDIRFLFNEAENYKDHEYGKEIVKHIFRLVYDLFPEEERKQLDDVFQAMADSRSKTYEEGLKALHNGEPGKAEELFVTLIPDEYLFAEDQMSVYLAFNNPMERAIYMVKFKPKKQVRPNPIVDTRVFLSYAYLLIEKPDLDQALKILDLGLRYNPVDTTLLFEKGTVFQARKDMEQLREITDLAHNYAYTPMTLARVYRNYGYMFTELKDYDGAICAYLESLKYDEAAHAYKELLYIAEVIGKAIRRDEYLMMCEHILQSRNVLTEPSGEILGAAYGCAKMAEDRLEFDEALYYYQICYELTKDSSINEEIETIKRSRQS